MLLFKTLLMVSLLYLSVLSVSIENNYEFDTNPCKDTNNSYPHARFQINATIQMTLGCFFTNVQVPIPCTDLKINEPKINFTLRMDESLITWEGGEFLATDNIIKRENIDLAKFDNEWKEQIIDKQIAIDQMMVYYSNNTIDISASIIESAFLNKLEELGRNFFVAKRKSEYIPKVIKKDEILSSDQQLEVAEDNSLNSKSLNVVSYSKEFRLI